jgi:hypothetical protein
MREDELIKKARIIMNKHLVTTTLSTTDKEGNVDVAIVNTAVMADPETIKCARISTKKTYENLKETGKGMFMVIAPKPNPMETDGIRIEVELIKDETEGDEFDIMQDFVHRNFGPFEIKNLLTFKITKIRPCWEWDA